jgi:hypothetical protein
VAEAVLAIEFLSGLVGPLGADLDLAAASRPATLYGLGHQLLAYTPPAVALFNHQLINESRKRWMEKSVTETQAQQPHYLIFVLGQKHLISIAIGHLPQAFFDSLRGDLPVLITTGFY